MTLLDYLKIICRKWWVLVLTIILACSISVGITLADKSEHYNASVIMNMSPEAQDDNFVPNPSQGALAYLQQMIEEEAFVAFSTAKFRNQLMDELKGIAPEVAKKVNTDQLASCIGYKLYKGTNFTVYVNHKDKEVALTVLKAFDNIANDFLKQTSLMNSVVRINSIDIPIVKLVNSGDRLPKNLVLALIVGVLVALMIIILADLIRPTLLDKSRVEQLVGTTVLGEVNVSEVVENEKE